MSEVVPEGNTGSFVHELSVFDKNYRGSGMDFRPVPVSSEETESSPKDSSAVESVDSSASPVETVTLEEKAKAIHPSQLQVQETTVPVEKDSGQPKEPVTLKPPSSAVPKSG